MKKIFFLAMLGIVMLSCTDDSWKQELDSIKIELSNQKKLIDVLQQNTSISRIEQGEGMYTIHFSDGQSITLSNGRTPLITIGDNGNWYIDGIDTGKTSKGEDGLDGTTPIIKIGSNGNWFIDNVDTGIKAEGIDGVDAPRIISIIDNGGFLNFYFSDSSVISCIKESKNFKSDRWSGVVRPSETVSLKENYIRKNTFLSCNISFNSFQPFLIGRGLNKYAGYYLEILDDSLFVHHIGTADNIVDRMKHNLTFKNKISVYIDYKDKAKAQITLYAGSEKFCKDISWWAGGEPFLKNNGVDSFEVSFNFQAKDAKCPIWIYGDSYINWIANERWPYYIYKAGHTNWLADHLPGGNSRTFIKCFKNDLNYGIPAYAVWCLGMNDGSDKDDRIDENWLKSINDFIAVCKSKGITPILSTIPSVAIKNHKLKSQWVRNSGYRYIDMSNSVSENDSPIWFDGMISRDNIHPSALGAEAMAMQVLIDFPEITILK